MNTTIKVKATALLCWDEEGKCRQVVTKDRDLVEVAAEMMLSGQAECYDQKLPLALPERKNETNP